MSKALQVGAVLPPGTRRPSRRDVRTIDARHRAGVAEGMRDLWRSREVVWAFVERHVRAKYKQAALGVAWAVIQPLAFLLIFSVVFSRVPTLSAARIPYAAFALAVLVPWSFLQTAITFGTQAIVTDGSLVRKVYFVREAPVLGAVLGASLDFVIGLGLFLILSPFLRARLSWTILLAIPLWAVLASLAYGLALLLAGLNVYYRDIRYLVILFLQIWMFASPVVYPLTAVPDRWRALYILANPAAGLFDAFRRALALGQLPDPAVLFPSVIETFLVLWLGCLIFKRLEPEFADSL